MVAKKVVKKAKVEVKSFVNIDGEKVHAPLACNQCGVPLEFIEYGHKTGKDGREATWPIYQKCVNPGCVSGRKNLVKAAGGDDKGGWEKDLKARRNTPVKVLVERSMPAIEPIESEALQKTVARAARVIGLPDRTTYRFYQLDGAHRLRDLSIICQTYALGTVSMMQDDVNALVPLASATDPVRVEQAVVSDTEVAYELVCPLGRFPINLVHGLSAGYFYVAVDIKSNESKP